MGMIKSTTLSWPTQSDNIWNKQETMMSLWTLS